MLVFLCYPPNKSQMFRSGQSRPHAICFHNAETQTPHPMSTQKSLFELLLRAKLVRVAALALAAVGGTGREAGLRNFVSASPSLQQTPNRSKRT